jgi:hypothetical protein
MLLLKLQPQFQELSLWLFPKLQPQLLFLMSQLFRLNQLLFLKLQPQFPMLFLWLFPKLQPLHHIILLHHIIPLHHIIQQLQLQLQLFLVLN